MKIASGALGVDLIRMKNIFIIGSTGYIGSCLFSRLNSAIGVRVVSVGRSGAETSIDLISGNTAELLKRVNCGDVAVFLASVSSPAICKGEPALAQCVNVKNTGALIGDLLEKGVRVIFSSSDVVFGAGTGVHHDADRLSPFGDYGKMKTAVEVRFKDSPLFKVVRFSYVLGPGDKYSDMLAEYEISQDELEVFSGFERSVVSLNDVLDGITRLIESWDSFSHSAVNFAGPGLESRARITELMAKELFPRLKFRIAEAPEGFWDSRPKAIEMDCTLFRQLLGRKPESLEEMINNWSFE